MAFPPLRQPKYLVNIDKNDDISIPLQVIVNLKGDLKVVVSRDAYNGIISSCAMYKCIFCKVEFDLDSKVKRRHMDSAKHRLCLDEYPHIEIYGSNLIRQIEPLTYYCTICNVVITNVSLARHLSSDSHKAEHAKAIKKASIYKPM